MANSILTLSLFSFHLLLLSCLLPASSLPVCDDNDLKALLAIKSSFNVPNPFPGWDPAIQPCCDWDGIVCNEAGDATGRVYSVDISADADIAGPVPPAFGDLPTIEVIRLHKLPNVTSPIPRSLTKLKKLRFLTIDWAGLTGPIPGFLSQLPSLTSLDLSFNHLSGSIPPSLANSPTLNVIDFSRNHLTGTIPANLFQKKKTETPIYLILSHNNLSGPIPPAFGGLDFAGIDLSRNQLSGDASFLFGKGKAVIDSIVLSRNKFEFDLSRVEFPESNLVTLELEHNKIYGSIPEQITKAEMLQQFNVSYNRLCGEIPAGGKLGGKFGLIQFDKYSFFHNKCLCGPPLEPCK